MVVGSDEKMKLIIPISLLLLVGCSQSDVNCINDTAIDCNCSIPPNITSNFDFLEVSFLPQNKCNCCVPISTLKDGYWIEDKACFGGNTYEVLRSYCYYND